MADPRGQDWYYIQSFDGADLLRLTINLARWPQSIPHLPGMVDDIAEGQYHDLSHFLQRSGRDNLFSEGMNLSVNCQEINPVTQRPKNKGVSLIFPSVYDLAIEDVQQRVKLCNLWFGEDWSLVPQSAIASDIPALVLIGELDSVIPNQWSEQATAGLTHRIELSIPNTGHGVLTSASCSQKIVAAFLLNPAKMPDANCQQK